MNFGRYARIAVKIFFFLYSISFSSQEIKKKKEYVISILYKDPERGRILAKKEAQYALIQKDIESYLDFLSMIPHSYYEERNFKMMIESGNTLLKESRKFDNKVREASSFRYLANAYSGLAIYTQSKKCIEQGLKAIQNTKGDKACIMRGMLYGEMSEMYNEMSDYNHSLIYSKKSLNEYKKEENEDNKKQDILVCYSNMAMDYYNLKKIDSALYYNNLADTFNPKKYGLLSILASIKLVYSQCYHEKGLYKLAIQYAQETLTISDSINDTNHKSSAYRELIKSLFKL